MSEPAHHELLGIALLIYDRVGHFVRIGLASSPQQESA